MMDSVITIIMAFSVLLIVIIASGCISGDIADAGHGEGEVCSNGTCFRVEIPDGDAEMARGLMFRESMDQDRGMLFIFEEEGVYPFWMKNTRIPLDIIWMDAGRRVVFISSDTQPCESDPCKVTDPGRKAKYALEINAGISERIGLDFGDVFEFRL